MRAHPATLIRAKRDGDELTPDQIRDFVTGVVDGTFTDSQLGAFLMAVCCRGMTDEETAALTLSMRDSGTVLDLSSVHAPKVDKHSTGGVGDKVSLFLAPLVAAAGVSVPMISGRGLGHTGGTLDKLASIPGYRTELSHTEFAEILGECSYVMGGASADIAPADRRMYATRDVTATIESIPLITSSILSKKLAEGIDALVLDVKCGRAAFMRSRAEAEALTRSLVAVGRAAGKQVSALITDMDSPLGCAVGNSLEVAEVVACLHGGGPSDLVELTFALAAEMLVLGGAAPSAAAALPRLHALVQDGSALSVCRKNVELQGGDPAFLEDPAVLGRAPNLVSVAAPHSGHVMDLDPLEVGLVAMDLGAGRRAATDSVDPLVGVVVHKKRGDPVRAGESLCTVHARTAAAADVAAARLVAAYTIGDEPTSVAPIVLAHVQ